MNEQTAEKSKYFYNLGCLLVWIFKPDVLKTGSDGEIEQNNFSATSSCVEL